MMMMMVNNTCEMMMIGMDDDLFSLAAHEHSTSRMYARISASEGVKS